MKKIIAAAILSAAIATPALAQDDNSASVRKPFTGPFVGAVLGYDKARGYIPGVASGTQDGLLYGANIGYDMNIGGALVGVEGEFTDSDTKASAQNVAALGDSLSVNTGRDYYAGIRLGGQVANNLALYAKGGYTNQRLANYYFDNAGGVTKNNVDLEGYRLGAGVETTYHGLTGRLEYRYSNYGKVNIANTPINGERHQVAAVLGYRF